MLSRNTAPSATPPCCPGQGEKDTKGEVQGNQLMWKTRSGQAEISTCLISADAPEVVPNNVGNCLVLIYV